MLLSWSPVATPGPGSSTHPIQSPKQSKKRVPKPTISLPSDLLLQIPNPSAPVVSQRPKVGHHSEVLLHVVLQLTQTVKRRCGKISFNYGSRTVSTRIGKTKHDDVKGQPGTHFGRANRPGPPDFDWVEAGLTNLG
ncbi:unnamed protein product [Linum trigynum]|uniref:Uncharacterized protein n=1 Tax=Linum trigynum TaxID=586398 RepID=A0AAV2G6T1_9ROSI